MARLTSRQKFIPGGFKFYDPHLKWTAPANASFQVICDGLRNVRMANPGVTKANNLSTDANQIADEVDFFNASICERMGWNDYITGAQGGSAAPFPQPPPRSLPQRLQSVAAGAKTIVEWITSGAEAVPQEQANARASVCSGCPLNDASDFTKLFTVPVSAAIHEALNARRDMKLETPYDGSLHVCSACLCPMKLKVHVPFEKFYSKMSQETKDALHESCWIRSEAANAL
jgi:hypothetical protein